MRLCRLCALAAVCLTLLVPAIVTVAQSPAWVSLVCPMWEATARLATDLLGIDLAGQTVESCLEFSLSRLGPTHVRALCHLAAVHLTHLVSALMAVVEIPLWVTLPLWDTTRRLATDRLEIAIAERTVWKLLLESSQPHLGSKRFRPMNHWSLVRLAESH